MKSHFPCFPGSGRRRTRRVMIGEVPIGGGAPIAVQSMTKTDTRDVKATLSQIKRLEKSGCEIVRIAVPDMESARVLCRIRRNTRIPIVADIHFDHRLALEALEQGVDGLRINPGNIGGDDKVKEVVLSAKERNVPIRIGVNAGSLEKTLLRKYGGATPEAMVESALRHVHILEKLDFSLIKISLKASDIGRTVRASQLLAEEIDYPFHAGITEAGGVIPGTVKSSAGLALLLNQGLADTIRVSLTAPPEREVKIAFLILSSMGLRLRGPDLISCPMCGRCEVDLFKIAGSIERQLGTLKAPLSVAVMGCMVNGPGEAKEADIGVAFGRGKGVIFRSGKITGHYPENEIVSVFVREVRELARPWDADPNKRQSP